MASTRLASMISVITSSLIFALGVIVVGLQQNAITRVDSYLFRSGQIQAVNHTASPGTRTADSYFFVATYNQRIRLATSHGVVAAGAIALACGFISLGTLLARATSKSSPKRYTAPPRRSAAPYIVSFCSFASFVAALVVFSYASVAYYQRKSIFVPRGYYLPEYERNLTSGPISSPAYISFLHTYEGEIGGIPSYTSEYMSDTYSLEGFTCQVRNFALDSSEFGLNTVCELLMAARWILLPLFLIALISTGVAAYLIKAGPDVTHNGTGAKVPEGPSPTIVRMQHKKDHEKTMEESGLAPSLTPAKADPSKPAPQIKKMQKPGREMK